MGSKEWSVYKCGPEQGLENIIMLCLEAYNIMLLSFELSQPEWRHPCQTSLLIYTGSYATDVLALSEV